MKLRATYVLINANPFWPRLEDFFKQFRYAVAEVSDDSDLELMEKYAREKTPEGFRFLRLKKIDE